MHTVDFACGVLFTSLVFVLILKWISEDGD
jgi:hypothetical protein